MLRCSILSTLATVLSVMALPACSQPDSPSREASGVTGGAPTATDAVSFVENTSEPFGTFDDVSFVRHTGLFEGETSLGAFRVPYEIIAPENPSLSNGTVLVEPPHFLAGTVGREVVLGHDLVFQTVSGYATVGFGENGQNILDPTASNVLLAGNPVANPGTPNRTGRLDEEILIQFTRSLTDAPFARDVLGKVDRLYAYGFSQTAAALLESQRNLARTSQQGLFDLTLLHTAQWKAPEPGEAAFDFLSGAFEPLEGVGKVLFVETEADLVMSDAKQFRRVAGLPAYRLYEVAGAEHSPLASNSLDHSAVARAIFVAGDRWVRSGMEPPASLLIKSAPPGEVDPVYDEETGIARDGDLNAREGLRLPDLEVSRAQFIASDLTTPVRSLPQEYNKFSGSMVDLACEPETGSDSEEPRFRSHEAYVAAFNEQVEQLQEQGFLLQADADALKARAAGANVGQPGTCEGDGE